MSMKPRRAASVLALASAGALVVAGTAIPLPTGSPQSVFSSAVAAIASLVANVGPMSAFLGVIGITNVLALVVLVRMFPPNRSWASDLVKLVRARDHRIAMGHESKRFMACLAVLVAIDLASVWAFVQTTTATLAPSAMRAGLETRIESAKEALTWTDGSKPMTFLPGKRNLGVQAAESLRSFVLTYKEVVSPEDKARSLLTLAALESLLGRYSKANDAIFSLSRLPSRFDDHHTKASLFLREIRRLRGEPEALPDEDPRDVRGSRIRSIVIQLDGNKPDAALAQATDYIEYFKDDAVTSNDPRIVNLYGQALVLAARSQLLVASLDITQTRVWATAGITVAHKGKQMADLDPITREDFARLEAEAQIILADIAHLEHTTEQEIVHARSALNLLLALISDDGKTGLKNDARELCERLANLYRVNGDPLELEAIDRLKTEHLQ